MAKTKIERTVTLENGFYVVRGIGPGGYYAKQLWAVRGMKWDKARQAHAAPASQSVYLALTLIGYTPPLCPVDNEEVIEVPASQRQSLRIPQYILECLRPYQLEGVRMIQRWDGRVLLGDEMGIGKTLQVLAWLSARVDAFPVVLVCPFNAKWGWVDEVIKWNLPWNIGMAEGLSADQLVEVRRRSTDNYHLIIVNYDILAGRSVGKKGKKKTMSGWVDFLKDLQPRTLVLDECHVLRNKDAQRTDAVTTLAKGVPHLIGMTGSPIINEVMDLFNVLQMIRPKIFKSRWVFGMKYCNPVFNERACKMDFEGCKDPKGLYELLRKTALIRRMKSEVLKDLPPKQRQNMPLLTAGPWKAEYEALADQVRSHEVEGFEAMVHLRQYAAFAKLDAAHSWINEFLQTGKKLVLLCHHREVGSWMLQAFDDCAVPYHVGMSSDNKRHSIEMFEKDPDTRLFIGSINACGVAINGLQTTCSDVAVLELPWSPAILQQAEDRVHRMGQKAKVNVWYLMAKGTVDEYALEVVVGKSGLAGGVLDNTLVERNAISQVLYKLRNRLDCHGSNITI